MNAGVLFEAMFPFSSSAGVCTFFFKKIVIISKKNALKISEVKVLSDNLHHAVKIATNLFSLNKQILNQSISEVMSLS